MIARHCEFADYNLSNSRYFTIMISKSFIQIVSFYILILFFDS